MSNEIVFEDFEPMNNCVNENSMGEICVHCNRCGRFDKQLKEEDEE